MSSEPHTHIWIDVENILPLALFLSLSPIDIDEYYPDWLMCFPFNNKRNQISKGSLSLSFSRSNERHDENPKTSLPLLRLTLYVWNRRGEREEKEEDLDDVEAYCELLINAQTMRWIWFVVHIWEVEWALAIMWWGYGIRESEREKEQTIIRNRWDGIILLLFVLMILQRFIYLVFQVHDEWMDGWLTGWLVRWFVRSLVRSFRLVVGSTS